MIVSQIFLWFILTSFLGWIFESGYCTLREHRWQNRGFLYGPSVPLYGFGATLALLVFRILPRTPLLPKALSSAPIWQIFLICMAGSAVLEYTTSVLLEKLFNATWWDYSNMPLNLHGRVALPASIGFGVAGIVVVRVLIPLGVRAHHLVRSPMVIELWALAAAVLLGVDLALTVSNLTDFATNVAQAEAEVNRQMERAYSELEAGAVLARQALEEKREQLITANVERLLAGTSHIQGETVRRIRHFGLRSARGGKALGERLLRAVRDRLPGDMNKTN